jgi:hypothetical protein
MRGVFVGSSSSTKLMKKSGVESVPSRTEKQQGKKKETKTRKELRVLRAKVHYQRVLLVFDFSYTWCACAQTRATREELMAAARVAFQTARCRKSLLANITFVRLFSSVSTHVTLQMTRLMKALLANITFVRFLSRVNTYVSL